MSHSKQTIEDDFQIDLYKLDCFLKRQHMSASKLSTSIGKSSNWVSSLKRRKSNPAPDAAIIKVSEANAIAHCLRCTMQDIRAYSVVPDCIKKDFREPFVICRDHQLQALMGSIEKLPEPNRSICVDFLCYYLKEENDSLNAFMLQCVDRATTLNTTNIRYGDKWWVSLFLSKLIEQIWKANNNHNSEKALHIPDETELRRTYCAPLQKGPDGRITDTSRMQAEKALTRQLNTAIRHMIDAVLDDDDALENISKECVNYLCKHFIGADRISDMTIQMYKTGYF